MPLKCPKTLHLRPNLGAAWPFLLLFIPSGCNREPTPAATPATITIQIPAAVTNFLTPRFIQPDPVPDFQIIQAGAANLQGLFLINHKSGETWQYTVIKDSGQMTPGWFPVRYWELPGHANPSPLTFDDLTTNTPAPNQAPTEKPTP